MFNKEYDIIVVGGGHAGCEAALAGANLGSKILLITMNIQNIAQMSCNPAMGGIAKGQIIREIDALGGGSGIITDKSLIQFRMLNRSKGPAMWSPRAQNDRMVFSIQWRMLLESHPNIDLYQDNVVKLIVKENKIKGVLTELGVNIKSKSVILTAGTFLNGVIHIGKKKFKGGRISENYSSGITEQLKSIGFESNRLKTGTPPRVDARSLDFSKMEEQKGDDTISGFSFLNIEKISSEQQKSCHIVYTNKKVHEILKTGFDKSPMFIGRIEGIGPRYCPSIEDKINRFSHKDRHQLFVEPEGFNTVELYINGFSSSLPEEIQYKAMCAIEGFENCKFFRPGYAIEYDYFPPQQLRYSLETNILENLFFAGQINGTTGYEEAACQGLIAGINAHQKINEKNPLILKRDEAYIGVLIDDLISKGTQEPYRMFTSRAEFRTLLRQDNADIRLSPIGYHLGLIKENRYNKVIEKIQDIENIKNLLYNTVINPYEINSYLEKINSSVIKEKQKISKLLMRPEITIKHINELIKNKLNNFDKATLNQVEIQIKYSVYIEREKETIKKINTLENLPIPENFNYSNIKSLSSEAIDKLKKIKPTTIGQAYRISGINPTDIQILIIYMRR
ncbi:MAG: tRNA uridine-5-carboxymethylaminomethyl(34) synthesis enzyme MnmG [Chitinophagaceae bacterium]